MDKFTNESKNQFANSSMLGVGAYMGGHLSVSKNSPEKVIKKIGNGASFGDILKQTQKEDSSLKEYSL